MAQQSVNIGTAANDGTGDSPRAAGIKLNANAADAESRLVSLEAPTPVTQPVVAAGVTLVVTRLAHQGATIILNGAGATISFNATTEGDGVIFSVLNRTGSNWTIPTFTGATKEYHLGAAHTQLASLGGAAFETYSRSSTRYITISGDTV